MLSSKDSLNIGASYLGKANFNNGFSSFSRLGTLSGKTLAMYIKSLFANNEVGFAYDPNDLSTLYQDAAGTIPVTAAGQPVGLMLDKSKGLMLGPEIIINGQFIDGFTSWTNGNNYWSIVNGRAYHPASANLNALEQLFSAKSSMLKVEFNIEVIQGTAQALFVPSGAVVNIGVTTAKQVTLFAPAGTTSIQFKRLQPSTAEFYVDNISIKELAGNHAYQTTSASRPLLQRNATTGAYYLEFDGTDDFLVTNPIDFTATDKISLFAGVRKLSDAASGILCELSTSTDTTTNKGSFVVGAPYAVTGYGFQTLGGGTRGGVRTYGAAPTSDVVSAYLNLGAANTNLAIRPRRNGVFESAIFGGTDGLGGNYGNYPLYIGRRGGTTFPFNGHLYSLIGIGRLTTDSETIALEKSIAKNVGVTL